MSCSSIRLVRVPSDVPLQTSDHIASGYERPNRRWQCGHLADGRPCHIGPDARGRCRATYECRPFREGERWLCTRPVDAGGECERGPRADGTCCSPIPPCAPRRTQWGRRRLASIWTVVVTTSLALLMLSSPRFEKLLMPGQLARHHGQIEDCGDCHASYREGPSGWLLAALSPSNPGRAGQQCLACHEYAVDSALSPHTIAPDGLVAPVSVDDPRPAEQRLTGIGRGRGARAGSRPAEQRLIDMLFAPPHEAAAGGIPCATCHREHRGGTFDRTELSNARCQACHEATFSSFSDGHPAFTDYPRWRRTRIVFDHRSHISRHFPEREPPREDIGCRDCHLPDDVGASMVVRSREVMCAACHDDIDGPAGTGPRGEDGGPVVRRLSAPADSLTVFSHAAHLNPDMDGECETCHAMKEEQGAYGESFAEYEPTALDSDFGDLDISACVDCHTPEAAGDDCTSCHRYHAAGPARQKPASAE